MRLVPTSRGTTSGVVPERVGGAQPDSGGRQRTILRSGREIVSVSVLLQSKYE